MTDRLSRRAALSGGAAIAASAAASAAAAKAGGPLNPILKQIPSLGVAADFWMNVKTLVDETVENFALQQTAGAKKGYRVASLSGFGAPGAMRLAAVLRFDPTAPEEMFVGPIDQTAFGLKHYELKKVGWNLAHVAAAGGFSDAQFCGVFRKGGPAGNLTSNSSPEQFRVTC